MFVISWYIVMQRIVLIVFCVLLFGCASASTSDTVFNQTDAKGQRIGFWSRYYRNGKRAYLAEFRNGRLVGRMIRYDELGNKRVSVYHRGDGHKSFAELYSPDGKVVARGVYYDQKKDSIWLYYGSQGQVVEIERWVRGLKDGEQLKYSDEGLVAERQRWRNGKQNGAQELYYASGVLRMKWHVVDDVEDGEMVYYFSGGGKRMAGKYVAGKREGYWTVWDLDGRIEEQTEYRNGIAVNAAAQARIQDSIMESLFRNAGKIPEPSAEMGNNDGYGY